MKLVIAGSRTLTYDNWIDVEFFQSIYLHFKLNGEIKEIISGGASGIDSTAEKFASVENIPFKEFPANWNAFARAAGPMRNKEMAEYGDALLLIWDGESKGSANMKKEMQKLKKPIYEVIIRKTL